MRIVTTLTLILVCAAMCDLSLVAQQQGAPGQVDGPLTENPQYKQKSSTSAKPANTPPPRSDEESSSNQTRIDLSPPQGDSLAHPDGGHAADDVMELHEWNPMRAMKDVEVGDYYFKNGNFKAAASRFREALQFKPHDATATFKLAQTLEKTSELSEARAHYEEYLVILKDGPYASEAKKALDRLKKDR